MNAAPTRSTDVAINSVAQPAILHDSIPPLIKRRWNQAVRVNNRADWKEMAYLCGTTAISHFKEHDYDPNNPDFRALCRLARLAHLRSVHCLIQGIELTHKINAVA